MKGSPLLQVAGLVLALALLAFPLHHLTSGVRKEIPPIATVAASELKSVELKLLSSAVPYSFEIQFLGKPLWAGTSQQTVETKTVQIPFPPEGVDLTVDAHWTNLGMAALQFTVTPADQPPLSQTLWGERKVSGTITFKEGSQ
jgi:hypothetical protein